MKEKIKAIFKSNKAITGIDLVTAVVVLTLFVGVIGTLIVRVYATSLETKMSTYAMAYATQILEKIDEKAYEEVNDQFVSTLKTNKEIAIPDQYTITISVSGYDEQKADIIKKIKLTITYKVGNKPQMIEISKLKVKEIGR